MSQSEARYRAFVENSQDGIWRFDIEPAIPLDMDRREMIATLVDRAIIGDCNIIFAKVCGLQSVEQAYGLPLQKIGSKNYRQDAKRFVLNDYRLTNHETFWRRPDGKQLCLQTSAQGTIENNKLVSIWGVTRDATEHRQYVDRLEYQAAHDSLTGLPNRTKLREIVNDAIEAHDADYQMALIIIDLDRFKEINDTLGHHVGDAVIQEIGPRIKDYLRVMSATIARLGGDEFAIFLPEIKNIQQVKLISRQLLECIRQDLEIDSMHVEVRASAGVAIFPDQAKDFPTLLRYADVAMYCAKKDMSNVAIYNADNDQHSAKRLLLMGELGKAIRNDALSLHYQPKISLDNNHVVGVEALSRWHHPTMGFISPAEFVPIAEMTDLINDLTDWVLEKSLLQVSHWRKQGLNIKVAVNISARNLLNNKLCEKIQVLLSYYNLPASCLELEITESTLMLNAEKTVPLLKDINDLGIELSIDDFGTGYSSLAYLKRLPVKWLKIDYSFIVNMLEDEQDQIIVNSTINMAHNLGLSVVAEGVENDQVLRRLGSMQCEHAQGFFIARPMEAGKFETWYKQHVG